MNNQEYLDESIEGFVKNLYQNMRSDVEVLSLIGYTEYRPEDEGIEARVEMVQYYTSMELDTVQGSMREMVKTLTEYSIYRGEDARVLLVHNHPSGTREPSEADMELSRRMEIATNMLGVSYQGSYIYTGEEDSLLLVEGRGLTPQDRISRLEQGNVFNEDRELMFGEDHPVRRNWHNIEWDLMTTSGFMGVNLVNELDIDELGSYLGQDDLEPYLLLELDDSNNIRGLYELNLLQPREAEQGDEFSLNGTKYDKGLGIVFKRDSPRLALYDKREGIERDTIGLATDTRAFMKAMNVLGYPINFYIHD